MLEHRYKLLLIPEELALTIFRRCLDNDRQSLPAWFFPFELEETLPADAFISACYHSYDPQGFMLRIYSGSYEVVPDGEMIPRLKVAMMQMHRLVPAKEPAEPPAKLEFVPYGPVSIQPPKGIEGWTVTYPPDDPVASQPESWRDRPPLA